MLRVPAARVGSWLHSETRNIGVVVADPREGLDEIRRTVDEALPGASGGLLPASVAVGQNLTYRGSFDSILAAMSVACVTAACCCGLHA